MGLPRTVADGATDDEALKRRDRAAREAVGIAAELRVEAEVKRQTAASLRRTGSGLSLATDRANLEDCAQQHEDEAAALDARADAIDAQDQPAAK